MDRISYPVLVSYKIDMQSLTKSILNTSIYYPSGIDIENNWELFSKKLGNLRENFKIKFQIYWRQKFANNCIGRYLRYIQYIK